MNFLGTIYTIIQHDKEQAEKKDKEIQGIRNIQIDTETGRLIHSGEKVQPIPFD